MIRRMLLRWLIGIVAVLITIQLARLLGLTLAWIPAWKVIAFIPVLAVANAIIGNLLRFFSAPITCLTLGLFGFVINALVFWIAGTATGAHMTFLSALFGSICMTVIAAPLNHLIKENRS